VAKQSPGALGGSLELDTALTTSPLTLYLKAAIKQVGIRYSNEDSQVQ